MAASDFPKDTGDTELNEAADNVEAVSDKTNLRLQVLAGELARKRDDWIRQRRSQGIDKRWDQDIDQYHARDEANRSSSQMMEAAEQGFPVTKEHAQATRSTVFIGLTRQKTNAGEARFTDIVMPTDDRSWGILPMPVPQMLPAMNSTQPATNMGGHPVIDPISGEVATVGDVAQQIHLHVKMACELMQNEIDDQLTECKFEGECRKMAHYAAMLGTGIMKGPIVENQLRRAWTAGVDATGKQFHALVLKESAAPNSYSVDPRFVFPDPSCGDDHQKGEGIYERGLVTGKELRQLAIRGHGYIKDNIRKVLEEGPKRSATMDRPTPGPDKDVDTSYLNKSYEIWDYWGEVTYDDALAAGIDATLLPGLNPEDPLTSVSVCVVMVNDTIIKIFINPIDNGTFPYDFFVWEKVIGSVWGYGLPYLMRAQQKVINSAWRQLMDNLGITAGPQILIRQGKIQPADGQWVLTSRKFWLVDSDVADMDSVMKAVEFNSHADELINVIKFAMQLLDEETAVPMLLAGEKPSAPETLGGTIAQQSSQNVVLRRMVKQWDDEFIVPHIGRYYDFNMMHSDKEEIKGDFRVDARGVSALLVKDMQNQSYLELMQAGANPTYGIYLKLDNLFKKVLLARHIDPEDIMASPAEIQQRQQAQQQAAAQAPAIQVANIKAAAEKVRGDSQAQIAEQMAQLKEREVETNRAVRLEELQTQKEIAMLTLSAKQGISLQQVKKALALAVMQDNTKREMAAAEHHLKAQGMLNDAAQSPAPSAPGPFDNPGSDTGA